MSAITFLFWRFMEIITLIPILGMFAHLLRQYLNANILAPDHILILFITSALGVPYCIFTLFTYHRSPGNCRLVSIIDFGFFGTLIAAVYELRFIRNADCTDIQQGDPITLSLGIFGSANLNTVKNSAEEQVGQQE
ncbi:uncharacterized protein CTHT_0017640 [Thermochaetoides thermophila DSM 1495]|uniref:MARVEL domain-containing protein n=1 Tax=Chaetomium thermophilum (strain DSM 1495 / CBS 144.50 / IMI 039719) TaxID=759272 RepID=G0S2L4_CHATD|nr:hypothetical protein CTHT_0017640 [Thermochaetoides thermophila DSM 1495]EGS22247.1 hypothetical protein CTHT_0017640 [Thermochaetoides thermophila DSM 1495]